MICYKDRTFCGFDKCKHFGDVEIDPDNCFRSLTDKVRQRAEKIKLPIAQFCERPDCFESKKKKKDK